MNFKNTRTITICAMIAAIYAVLTFAIAPLSFGVFQFRISESLTILPLFTPLAIPGLVVGCLVSNLLGVIMGQAPFWDILFGTFATLGASICTYFIGRMTSSIVRYLIGALFPVIFNGIIIGTELTLFYGGLLWMNILTVGFGELIVCYVLGGVLFYVFNKYDVFNKILKPIK